jgi:enoyl-CoA hydratase
VDTRVTYERDGAVAVVGMDDGKVNALSIDMLADLNAALDQGEADGAIVLLKGRDGVFSAGFDLKTLQAGGPDAVEMLLAGFELSHRLLSFPHPVVIACTGHAMAMGLFLLLSGDYRLGASGADHRIVANEVAIGLTMPHSAVEICRQRLNPAHLQRVVNLSEPYTPDSAVEAGLLDAVVPPTQVLDAARARADAMTGLDRNAHTGSKLRLRSEALTALRAAIERDEGELRGLL